MEDDAHTRLMKEVHQRTREKNKKKIILPPIQKKEPAEEKKEEKKIVLPKNEYEVVTIKKSLIIGPNARIILSMLHKNEEGLRISDMIKKDILSQKQVYKSLSLLKKTGFIFGSARGFKMTNINYYLTSLGEEYFKYIYEVNLRSDDFYVCQKLAQKLDKRRKEDV